MDYPERAENFPAFVVWIKTLSKDQLQEYVIDAWWKGHLQEHDIHRFFIAEYKYKQKMVPTPVEDNK